MSRSERLRFVVAGDSRESIERAHGVAIWRCLADNGFVDRTSVSCVGFYRDVDLDSLLVVLPKAFNSREARARLEDATYQREQIYRLIRIFSKVRRDTAFSLSLTESNYSGWRERWSTDPVLDSFDAALRLRRDFRENGFYVRKANKYVANSSGLSVDWSRTMRIATMVFDSEGIFFDSVIHRARKRDSSHPLHLIHVSCLKEIFALTGERSEVEGVNSLDEMEFLKLKKSPDQFLRVVRASVFDERGRFLISALKSYLSESRLVSSCRRVPEGLLSYSKDFEFIWERMLRDLFSPGQRNRTLGAGKWHGWSEEDSADGIAPQVDILLKTGSDDVLVDAKDYRIYDGAKWQGSSSDHYKQVIYRQLLTAGETLSVANILAFPALNQKSLFRIHGFHHWPEIAGSEVFEVTVDYDRVSRAWLREERLDIRSEIAQLLEEIRRRSGSLTHASVAAETSGDVEEGEGKLEIDLEIGAPTSDAGIIL